MRPSMTSDPDLPVVLTNWQKPSMKRIAVAAFAVFCLTIGVRLLTWQDTRLETEKVQTGIAAEYRQIAQLVRQGGPRAFFDPTDPLSDQRMLGHPPGYPILRTIVGKLFGESNAAIQMVQVTCDAFAAVLIFLIAMEFFSFTCALIAGLLVALSPQFAWNSVLLLPDTVSVLPLLFAVYFLARALKNPRLITLMGVGFLIGLSCWLRANALLMAPFLAILSFPLFMKTSRLRNAAVLIAGALLVISPLTIRNWLVFNHFIPVSLGAGQTMLEGISDYDPAGRFGIPNTDLGIMKMEVEEYGRPDYYSSLFAPDGIARERRRLARAFGIIGDNPLWFLGVMVRRAGSMLRLERVRVISAVPSITNPVASLNDNQPALMIIPANLPAQSLYKSPGAELTVSSDAHWLKIVSAHAKYDAQFKTAAIPVKRDNDFLIEVPILVEEGRMTIIVEAVRTGNVIAFAVVDKAEVKDGEAQPTEIVQIPFVSGSEEHVCLAFNNEAPAAGRSVINVGAVELFELGPASLLWMRYPRLLIKFSQRLFITAVMLPLALTGMVILVRYQAWRALILLSAIPAYYLCVQSILHTEYRYVLALHYFLFVLVAFASHEIVQVVLRRLGSSEKQKL